MSRGSLDQIIAKGLPRNGSARNCFSFFLFFFLGGGGSGVMVLYCAISLRMRWNVMVHWNFHLLHHVGDLRNMGTRRAGLEILTALKPL